MLFFGHSDFGHSFVIRHSSFVIPCIRVDSRYSRAENSSQAEAAPLALTTARSYRTPTAREMSKITMVSEIKI
jgi:hypothetical protein